MCKTFQKQNENNNINNENNTNIKSTSSGYQNTVRNRQFPSAFSEISGLRRCNYHVLHTPYCTWSSPPPPGPPTSSCQREAQTQHFPWRLNQICIQAKKKKTKAVRLDKPLEGRSLVLKQNNNNDNINPLKY